MTTLIHGCVGLVSSAMVRGASGPEAVALLLFLLMAHFDRVDMGEEYTILN